MPSWNWHPPSAWPQRVTRSAWQGLPSIAVARYTDRFWRKRFRFLPPVPPRALSSVEREGVLTVLNSERFQDCAPAAIHASLLDDGQYLCSFRTMYRVLEENGPTRERRDQLVHPQYQKPELLPTAPNQLWSWDITKLCGPAKWTYFCLYVILDVFSRYVVGWMLAPRESAELAKKLIEETCEKQNIQPDTLGLYADRGSAMRSKLVALLLADLSVVSRPLRLSREWSRILPHLLPLYNDEPHHSGIGRMTPVIVHYGLAAEVRENGQLALDAAYVAHPERFVRRPPTLPLLPKEVWINKPPSSDENTH